MNDWTLEGELCRLAGAGDLASALRSLRLLPRASEPFELITAQDWYRAGAETYAFVFQVRQPSGERAYIIKACIAWSPGETLSETFDRWMSRRRLVTELGINTPALMGAGNAQLVEEFIAYELLDALRRAAQETRPSLLTDLGRTAGLLVKAGFAPLSTHDWRSRGDDVVLVDFGQDLGPSNIAKGSESGLLSEITDRIVRAKIELTADDLRLLGAAYEHVLGD